MMSKAVQHPSRGLQPARPFGSIALGLLLWFSPTAVLLAEESNTREIHPLASKEEIIRDRFQRFQDRVFRLREQLSEAEPQNAARLSRALTRAGELGLSDRLEEIIALLRDSSALDSAVDAQGKWLEDADRLLNLLLEQDSDNEERKREQERLQAYKEKLAELLQQEKSLRAGSAQLTAAQRMAAQLDQASRRLDALLERQGQVSKATQGGAAAADSKTAEQQQDLSRDTEQLAEDIAKLAEPPAEESQNSPAMESAQSQAQAAAQSTQSGSQAMSQASAQINAGSPSSAGEQQKQAEASLREAKAQLEAAKEALKQQPSSPEMGGQQKAVAQQAQGLGDQMRQDAASSSGGKQGQPGGKSGTKAPGLQNVDKAQQEMEGASESLDDSKPQDATPQQDRAIAQLEEAQRELEEALQQLRKEEREETLRDLEARFREMLSKQRPINEATVALDQVGRENFKRAEQLQLADLATNERALAEQASTCLHILDEEGTTIAFPRVVAQLAQDMSTAADRLAAAEVGPVTQAVEQEIIDTLEQLLEAVKKMQQENEQQQQAGKSDGGGEPPLLPASAELKLLKASQQRINTRTAAITESATAGREPPDAAARGLKSLAVRQVECSQIARQMRDRQ